VISVQTPAGRFRIYNTSDAPLFLCQSALDDPDGVFQVPFHPTAVPSPRFPAPFNPRTVLPQNYEEFIAYFFPTEVMKDYRAILTIRSNAGPITVPIHGRVETLPTVIQPGMLVDLVTDAMCIPPTTDLCKIRGIFEPVLTDGPVSIVDATFDGVPREAQLAFTDRGGTPQVWDRSGQTTRPFALEFAPPSDGGDDGPPGMPCIPTFHDLPARVQELISLRVEGRLLDRVHVFEDLPVTSLAAADGWVYLGTAEGLHVLDWRDDRKPTRVKTLRIGEIHTLSLPREILFAAVGDEIVALNIRWPDNPLLIDAVRLSAPPTAVAASAEGAFAVDGRELYRIVHADNKLRLDATLTVPGGASRISLTPDWIFAAGESAVSLFSMDVEKRLHFEESAKTPQIIQALSRYGRHILVSGDFGTQAFLVKPEGGLHLATEYRRPHWSIGFIPDRGRDRAFVIHDGGRVELWRARVHRLDRTRFPDLLKLRFHPNRSNASSARGLTQNSRPR
jgi:hypothetical protein